MPYRLDRLPLIVTFIVNPQIVSGASDSRIQKFKFSTKFSDIVDLLLRQLFLEAEFAHEHTIPINDMACMGFGCFTTGVFIEFGEEILELLPADCV